MADTVVAVTAIIVSGVVGPGLNAWWTRSRQRADHHQQLRNELAAVLDDGAHALGQAKRSFERVYKLYSGDVPRTAKPAQEAFEAWRHAMAAVRHAEDRVALRFGSDHPVHQAYLVCEKALDDQRPLAWGYEQGTTKGMERAVAAQAAAHSAFAQARRDYIAAGMTALGFPLATRRS